jgi:hypothetical protein
VHTTRTILAIALVSPLFLQKQTVKGPPTQSEKTSTNPGFHWNWKDWQELSAEQSLRKAQLPNQQKKAIASAIADEIRPMMSDLEIVQSEPELQKAALDTRVKMIDLNGDGVPEVVAQGMVKLRCDGKLPVLGFSESKIRLRIAPRRGSADFHYSDIQFKRISRHRTSQTRLIRQR